MTYLEEYFTALLDGKIMACEKMKLVSEKILQDLYKPESITSMRKSQINI